ncbi:MAG: hypothetical protein VX899_18315 [Myxococcota bacterium]|nr:hypothetical protein [Myxococcota bacterium]
MKAWSRLVALLSTKEHPRVLALFRIALGLCAVYTIGTVMLHGVVDDVWMDVADGGYRHLTRGNFLVQWLGGTSPQMVWGMSITALVASIAMTLGLGGRFTVFLTLWTVTAATDFNSQASGSYDELLSSAIFLLLLGRPTQTFSLDSRIRRGRFIDHTPIYAFPRWMALFQLVLVYWATGMQKLSFYWVPGGEWSALYYILQQPSWQRWDMSWVAYIYPLTQVMTGLTWFWEVGAPLLLLAFWYRHTRQRPGRLRRAFNRIDFRGIYALIGIGLHLSVFATMEVGPFSWVSLSYYLCFFSPDEYHRAWQRLMRALGRAPDTDVAVVEPAKEAVDPPH